MKCRSLGVLSESEEWLYSDTFLLEYNFKPGTVALVPSLEVPTNYSRRIINIPGKSRDQKYIVSLNTKFSK